MSGKRTLVAPIAVELLLEKPVSWVGGEAAISKDNPPVATHTLTARRKRDMARDRNKTGSIAIHRGRATKE